MLRLLTCLFLPVLGLGAPAHADGSFYLRVTGGLSSLSDSDLSGDVTADLSFDTGQAIGGAVGYDYASSPFRVELEYMYRTGDAEASGGVTGGDFASTIVAINGYYDLAPVAAITPYVGAGLGYITEIDFDVEGAAAGEYSDRGGVVGQLMLGGQIDVSPRLVLNGELRYVAGGSPTLSASNGDRFDAEYAALELLFGATFRF